MKQKNTSLIGLVVAAIIFGGCLMGVSLRVFGQEQKEMQNPKLSKEARITMKEARDIALRQVPGKVESEELEKEHGVLLYSFDIRNDKGTITEAQVDAKNGRFIGAKEETKADEEKEKREDENKSKNNKSDGVSNIKNGTVNGAKKVGHGIQTAANKVAKVLKH